MRARFNQSFKIQAVEKALSPNGEISLKEVADSLGVGDSTLNKWMVKSRNQAFEPVTDTEISSLNLMSRERRPLELRGHSTISLILRLFVSVVVKLSPKSLNFAVYQQEAH